MNIPLVSVIITSYNYDNYLEKTIQSVLDQTYPAIETIIVDDGSTDQSVNIIKSYGDDVIPILKENGGQGSSINAGFVRSSGVFTFFLDSDDYYMPETISNAVKAFTEDVVMVQSRMLLVDEQDKVIGTHPASYIKFDSGDLRQLVVKCGFFIGTVTTGNGYRRSVLEKILPLDEKKFFLSPDGYFLNIVPFYGKIATIDKPNAYYRAHEHNNAHFMVNGQINRQRLQRKLKWIQNENETLYSNAKKFGFSIPSNYQYRMSCYSFIIRLFSLKFAPEQHPYPRDSSFLLGIMGIASLFRREHTLRLRLSLLPWFFLTALCPKKISKPLFDFIFDKDVFAGIRLLKRVMRKMILL